ncbi:hypothetical protein AMECASPLE_016948 [Ameca splendens]|uniref:Uncharacterized protein n=1 Tax=Ameca splendens TaxID=208324 RepID=A0ABV0Z160_9TELE
MTSTFKDDIKHATYDPRAPYGYLFEHHYLLIDGCFSSQLLRKSENNWNLEGLDCMSAQHSCTQAFFLFVFFPTSLSGVAYCAIMCPIDHEHFNY